jgi:hypothetical protein
MEVAAKGDPKFITANQVPRLRKRINIIIQRSDGRMHEASISEVDFDKQCVIVEWIENGETKGKSIEFPFVFDLNSTLAPDASKYDQPTSNGSDHHNGDSSESSSESDNGLMVMVPSTEELLDPEDSDAFPTALTIPVMPSVSGLPGGPTRRPVSGKYPRSTVTASAIPQRRQAENGTRDLKTTSSVAAARGTALTEPKPGGPQRTAHPNTNKGQDSARDRKTDISPRPSLPGNQGTFSRLID